MVADNGYAISVPSAEQSPAPINELVKGFAGLQTWTIDGTDYFEVRQAAREVVSHVRAGVGPALVHATGHPALLALGGRHAEQVPPPQELEWETATTRSSASRALVEAGVLTADEAVEVRAEARRIVADAAKAAFAGRPAPR